MTSWGKVLNTTVTSWVRDLNDPSSWGKPLIGRAIVSSGWYSPRSGQNHGGLDFAAPIGQPVVAVQGGRVLVADRSNSSSAGINVILVHDVAGIGPMVSRYIHLSKIVSGLAPGDSVVKGQLLGLVGETASEGKPHLHLDLQTCSAAALANYRRQYGWGRGTGEYAVAENYLNDVRCTPVPGEPSIPVDGYLPSVIREAKEHGMRLRSNSFTSA